MPTSDAYYQWTGITTTTPTYTMPQYLYNGPPPMQMASGGNIGLNHQEVMEVREELNRRRMMRQSQQNNQKIPANHYVVITDRNESRIFKPLLPPNHYVHEDDHIEWLIGRTRAVQSKLSWAKVA